MALNQITLNAGVTVDNSTDNTTSTIVVINAQGKIGKTTYVPPSKIYIVRMYASTVTSATVNKFKPALLSGTFVPDTTASNVGIIDTTVTYPVAIDRGSNIVSALITLPDAALRANVTPVYPVYCWVALFRIEYNNRYCIAFLEFQVPTPTNGTLRVGQNNTYSTNGLLGTSLGTTDGIYEVSRFLIPNNNTGSPAFTVSSTISLSNTWLLGAEMIFPANAGGTATASVNTAKTPGGAGASNITYNTGLPYNQFLGTYRNVALTLRIT